MSTSNSTSNTLTSVLGISPQPPTTVIDTEAEEEQGVTLYIDPEQDVVNADISFVRNTHFNLIDKGNEALNGILEVAKDSQHPRAYEVAATLLKNLSDMADKIVVMHQTKKEMEQKTGTNPINPITVEKAVFVGTTTDLLRKIKSDK